MDQKVFVYEPEKAYQVIWENQWWSQVGLGLMSQNLDKKSDTTTLKSLSEQEQPD